MLALQYSGATDVRCLRFVLFMFQFARLSGGMRGVFECQYIIQCLAIEHNLLIQIYVPGATPSLKKKQAIKNHALIPEQICTIIVQCFCGGGQCPRGPTIHALQKNRAISILYFAEQLLVSSCVSYFQALVALVVSGGLRVLILFLFFLSSSLAIMPVAQYVCCATGYTCIGIACQSNTCFVLI